MKGERHVMRLVPAGVWALTLALLASLPGEELHGLQTALDPAWLRVLLSDPVLHAVTFGLLALLVARAFPQAGRGTLVRAAALVIGYGLVLEVYQAVLPWRSGGMDDLCWDAVGVVLALAGICWKSGV